MEARIAKVEADVDHLKRSAEKADGKLDTLIAATGSIATTLGTLSDLTADLPKLGTDVSTLIERTAGLPKLTTDVSAFEERTKHLPTKPYIFACLGAVIAAIGISVTLIVHLIPHAP